MKTYYSRRDYLDNKQLDLQRLEDDSYGWKQPEKPKVKVLLPAVLFCVTFIAVTFAGAFQYGVNPFDNLSEAYKGLPFALVLMGILLSDEMGHFIMSKHHDVSATLPYFIPMFNIIGTFGAVIRMKSPIPDKNALVDIGAAGPIVGFVAALPALIIGIKLSPVVPAAAGGMKLGYSLLVGLLTSLVRPGIPAGHELAMGPIAFAGWIGMFVTSMNLIPIGQLDGGHVAYALFGRWYHALARLALLALVAMGVFGWAGWLFWALLILILLGVGHPSPMDPYQPLDAKRKFIAYLAMLILIITFIPSPITGL